MYGVWWDVSGLSGQCLPRAQGSSSLLPKSRAFTPLRSTRGFHVLVSVSQACSARAPQRNQSWQEETSQGSSRVWGAVLQTDRKVTQQLSTALSLSPLGAGQGCLSLWGWAGQRAAPKGWKIPWKCLVSEDIHLSLCLVLSKCRDPWGKPGSGDLPGHSCNGYKPQLSTGYSLSWRKAAKNLFLRMSVCRE